MPKYEYGLVFKRDAETIASMQKALRELDKIRRENAEKQRQAWQRLERQRLGIKER